eukprot:4926675-Amphidinium_carterae.2
MISLKPPSFCCKRAPYSLQFDVISKSESSGKMCGKHNGETAELLLNRDLAVEPRPTVHAVFHPISGYDETGSPATQLAVLVGEDLGDAFRAAFAVRNRAAGINVRHKEHIAQEELGVLLVRTTGAESFEAERVEDARLNVVQT